MTDLTVKISKIIDAPIEKVFDAWLNPKMMSKFMMGMPDMPESDVETDAREGGHFTIIMHHGGQKIAHTGKYLKISRPGKLVFTWASQYSVVDDSTVTLNFTKVDGNKTNIALSHVKFIDENARSAHEGGWACILDKLNEVVIR
ncbi:MAG: SRPBCC domain-containing protein [Desulfobacterales bacterium]|nr:SRPBCC domain-containing protein [Desulfobacterales bacterium]